MYLKIHEAFSRFRIKFLAKGDMTFEPLGRKHIMQLLPLTIDL